MVGTIKETSAVGFHKCISAEGRGWDNRCYHGWLDDIGRGDNTSAPVVLFVIGCGKWGVGHGVIFVGAAVLELENVSWSQFEDISLIAPAFIDWPSVK